MGGLLKSTSWKALIRALSRTYDEQKGDGRYLSILNDAAVQQLSNHRGPSSHTQFRKYSS
jgi:hypothetical protein